MRDQKTRTALQPVGIALESRFFGSNFFARWLRPALDSVRCLATPPMAWHPFSLGRHAGTASAGVMPCILVRFSDSRKGKNTGYSTIAGLRLRRRPDQLQRHLEIRDLSGAKFFAHRFRLSVRVLS